MKQDVLLESKSTNNPKNKPMKKLIILLALSLYFLQACGGEDQEPIDIAGEMQSQPVFTMSFNDQIVAGTNGSFCSNVLCFDQGKPNPQTFSYVSIQNGTELSLKTEESQTKNIESIYITLKDQEWKTVQNNIDFTTNKDGSYTIKEAFNKTGQLILHAKITFINGGYSESYFPIEIK